MPLTLDGSTGIEFPNGGTHAKAWVNFKGTSTVSIRQSGNVSSITDIAVGYYGINFTSPFVDANYAASGTGGGTSRSYVLNKEPSAPPTSSSLSVRAIIPNVGLYDDANVNVVVTR